MQGTRWRVLCTQHFASLISVWMPGLQWGFAHVLIVRGLEDGKGLHMALGGDLLGGKPYPILSWEELWGQKAHADTVETLALIHSLTAGHKEPPFTDERGPESR